MSYDGITGQTPDLRDYVTQEELNTLINSGYCKMANGSYIGTGTSGQSSPNTLTFEFKPCIVFISNLHYASGLIIAMIRSNNTAIGIRSGYGNNVKLTVSWSDKSVSWYGESHYNQFNYDGYTYFYVAFGF